MSRGVGIVWLALLVSGLVPLRALAVAPANQDPAPPIAPNQAAWQHHRHNAAEVIRPPAVNTPTVQPVPVGPRAVPLPSAERVQRLPALPKPEETPFTSSEAFVRQPPVATEPDELPPPRGQMQVEAVDAVPLLSLEDVLRSVEQDYPLLMAALEERGITAGVLESARAPFNTQVNVRSFSHALGFYEYQNTDLRINQPTWNAGNAYAGYMIGRGYFPTWYGNLVTNKGGEFRLGYEQALWQGLAIDTRRADFIRADIARRAAEPQIYRARIGFLRGAASSYWEWVAEGRKYIIAEQMLRIAVVRDGQVRERARLGDIAPLDVTDNRRIIVDREARLIANARQFQESAIRLSLYFRDRAGQPQIPEPNRLPRFFPQPRAPSVERLGADIEVAYRYRPELRQLALQRQSTDVSLELAQNQFLPTLNAFGEVSKDIGEEVALGEKTPTVIQAGVVGSVPVQRSGARGAIRRNQALLAQITAETRWARDQILTDVQTAMAALVAAYQQLEPIRQGVQLNYQMEVAERQRWLAGDSTLFLVNLREIATAEAASIEVDALANYYIALANYQAALGLDGLNYQQAMPFGLP